MRVLSPPGARIHADPPAHGVPRCGWAGGRGGFVPDRPSVQSQGASRDHQQGDAVERHDRSDDERRGNVLLFSGLERSHIEIENGPLPVAADTALEQDEYSESDAGLPASGHHPCHVAADVRTRSCALPALGRRQPGPSEPTRRKKIQTRDWWMAEASCAESNGSGMRPMPSSRDFATARRQSVLPTCGLHGGERIFIRRGYG